MKKIILILLLTNCTGFLRGQGSDTLRQNKAKKSDFRKEMREGNKLYDEKKHVEAETAYRKALDINNGASNAAFNLGDALYRQEKYDEAVKQFETASANMKTKEDKAKAYHNLGNSYFRQQKFGESIDAYKNALRNNPNDMETKTNLSCALRMLQQQQNEKQQNKDSQNKDNDRQDQQKDDQQKDDQQKDDEQKQEQNQNQNQQDKNQQQQQQQITPEDAQRILDALAQEEKNLQEKLKKKERAGRRSTIEKNW
ncbi:MAG: tetratricopeptide repeat protein [Bacteroidales bacterium]|jgi:tetratricopeptide (TPR) repeat protein|nr:tetratricopeptide repeat protein [Bacteroidales bacterium]